MLVLSCRGKLISQTIYAAVLSRPLIATCTLKMPSNTSEQRSSWESRAQVQIGAQQEASVLRASLADAGATRDIAADGVRRLQPITEAAIHLARGKRVNEAKQTTAVTDRTESILSSVSNKRTETPPPDANKRNRIAQSDH